MKYLAIALVVTFAGSAWMLRYNTTAMDKGEFVLLDRWTGVTVTCQTLTNRCFPLGDR